MTQPRVADSGKRAIAALRRRLSVRDDHDGAHLY
jgi:hypothetical protein